MPGYWSGARPVANMAVLHRDGQSWMSTTPFELESQEIGVRSAAGHVGILLDYRHRGHRRERGAGR